MLIFCLANVACVFCMFTLSSSSPLHHINRLGGITVRHISQAHLIKTIEVDYSVPATNPVLSEVIMLMCN